MIELLIVVAIIAILAAIAVPNFLEAQVRSKVSRAKSDQRTLATAIEAYTVDGNRAPIGFNEGEDLGLVTPLTKPSIWNRLTTPIAYITSIPNDPFNEKGRLTTDFSQHWNRYSYNTFYKNVKVHGRGYVWNIFTTGPSRIDGVPWFYQMAGGAPPNNVYDPSNGTVSFGQIIRTNKGIYTGNND